VSRKRPTAPLTPEEESRARALLTGPVPDSNGMDWRHWANELTWAVPRYAGPLIETLDARIEEARTLARAEVIAEVEALRQRDDNETDTGFLDRDTVDCVLAALSRLGERE
jgi:hypothetical protein